MGTRSRWIAGLLFVSVIGVPVPGGAESDEAVIGEVLEILRDRGIVDEGRYRELIAKNERYEATQGSLLDRIELSGDFRGRLENFWFDEDALGGERDNRHRGRYRLRIQGKARVNDHVTAVFRLASGQGLSRSTNTSFGDTDDFQPDNLFLDRAYIELRAPLEQDVRFRVGRMANPLRWKQGTDYLLWDPDINPEGVSVQWRGESVGMELESTAAYFILDEDSSAQDAHVFALQGAFKKVVSETLSFGGRATWYAFGSLGSDGNDADLVPDAFQRGAAFGNLAPADRPGDGIDVIELAAWVRCACWEDWPVLLFGHVAQNLSASDRVTGREEDLGFLVAVEVGDKRRHGKLGVGYYRLEADYFPALTIDSDITDFRTNRKGFTAYGAREILRNTDLRFSFFVGDEVRADALHALSVAGSDRMRLRTDIVVSF